MAYLCGFQKKKHPNPEELRCEILEATTRFELVNQAFAEPCLTTWLRRRIIKFLLQ